MVRSNDMDKHVRLGSTSWSRLDNQLYLGSLSENVDIYCDYIPEVVNKSLDIMVLDSSKNSKRPKMVMELLLDRVTSIFGLPTYSVALVGVDDLYKGFNVAPKVYSYLLKNFDGWVLRSGCSQSEGGKALWNNLCKQRGISVFACSPRNGDMHKCYYNDIGVLDCDVDVYKSNSPYHLYATTSR